MKKVIFAALFLALVFACSSEKPKVSECSDLCEGTTWKASGEKIGINCVYRIIALNSEKCGYLAPDGSPCIKDSNCAGSHCIQGRCTSTSCPVTHRIEKKGTQYPKGKWYQVKMLHPSEPYTSEWREVYDPDGKNCPSLNKPGAYFCTVDSECASKDCMGNHRCRYITPPVPKRATTDITVSRLRIASKNPAVGTMTSFAFTITNTGSDYLENIHWVLETGEGSAVFFKTPIELFGGEQAVVYTYYTYKRSGTFKIKVAIDPDNIIQEFNERNNSATSTVMISN